MTGSQVTAHALAAEQAVLGACLQGTEPARQALQILVPDDFFLIRHTVIFSVIQSLVARGIPPDLVTVYAALSQRGQTPEIGSADLALLVDQAPSAAHVVHHARIVKDKARLRHLQDLCANAVQKIRSNGTDSDSIVTALREDLENLGRDIGFRAEADQPLPLTSLRDLLLEPDEEHAWLVEDRLPTKGMSLLAGKPKAGKTTLARSLALAVARGEPWLGFKTKQGTVLYLALEEKRAEVRRHFQAMGATASDPIEVFVAPSPQDGVARLRAAAEQKAPGLIIVDPLLRMVRVKDANDYATVLAALEPLLSLARDTGAHVLAVHHLGKGERSGGDAILGSTAIFSTVDTALLLKRSERYRTLSSLQRYGEDLEEVVLTLDPETRQVSAGPSRREADEGQAGKAILEYLSTLDECVDEATIQEAVEGRKATKQRALRDLVRAGTVSRLGGGKRGDPYRYVSSSHAPATHGEPEKHQLHTDPTNDQDAADSPSRDGLTTGASSETWEPKSQRLEEVSL